MNDTITFAHISEELLLGWIEVYSRHYNAKGENNDLIQEMKAELARRENSKYDWRQEGF